MKSNMAKVILAASICAGITACHTCPNEDRLGRVEDLTDALIWRADEEPLDLPDDPLPPVEPVIHSDGDGVLWKPETRLILGRAEWTPFAEDATVTITHVGRSIPCRYTGTHNNRPKYRWDHHSGDVQTAILTAHGFDVEFRHGGNVIHRKRIRNGKERQE